MSAARAARSLYRLPEEPDQVARLARFRTEHPDVIIGAGEFGTWQARIRAQDGETVTSRYTLKHLLDRLSELTGQQPTNPGATPG